MSPSWASFCAGGNYFACLHLRSAYTRVKVISRRNSSIRIFIHYSIYNFLAFKKYSFKSNLSHWSETKFLLFPWNYIFFYLIVLKNITNFNIYLLCMIKIKTTATHTRRRVVHILTTFCRFNEDYSLCYMSYLLAFKYIFSRQGNKLGISCLAY